jgi:hypothetical protein
MIIGHKLMHILVLQHLLLRYISVRCKWYLSHVHFPSTLIKELEVIISIFSTVLNEVIRFLGYYKLVLGNTLDTTSVRVSIQTRIIPHDALRASRELTDRRAFVSHFPLHKNPPNIDLSTAIELSQRERHFLLECLLPRQRDSYWQPQLAGDHAS